MHMHMHKTCAKHARLQPLTPTVAGTLVPIARYIDWITTTPLLMYELGMEGPIIAFAVFSVDGSDGSDGSA